MKKTSSFLLVMYGKVLQIKLEGDDGGVKNKNKLDFLPYL